jgi:hypothetical protein
MSALTAIRTLLDRMAAGREASLSVYDGGDPFATVIDGAADLDFEAYLTQGFDALNADTDLAQGLKWIGALPAKIVNNLHAYIGSLGITESPLLGAYLAAYGGFRVPYWAAQCYTEAAGVLTGAVVRLPNTRVFPKGVLVADGADPAAAGLHKFGRFAHSPAAITAVDGPLVTATREATAAAGTAATAAVQGVVAAGILAVNQGAAQSIGGTFTCTLQDGTTKDIAVAFDTAAQFTQVRVGEQAVGSEAAAGQKVVAVAATAQFKAGEWVLIYESDTLQEVAQIASIQEDTSLTMESDLLNTFSTDAYVIPMFTDIAYDSGVSGSGNIDFYALPDRVVAL